MSNVTQESLTQKNASWRNLLDFSNSSSTENDDIHERALQLAKLIKGDKDLSGYVVGEVIARSFANPARIDIILTTFNHLAHHFEGDESYSDFGFTGKKAILKALDSELFEMLQTPGHPIVSQGPYDVSCPIEVTEDVDKAAERVVEYAEARNKWIVTHALAARQAVLAPLNDSTSNDQEFGLSVVEKALSIDIKRGQPDETDVINGLITILASGRHLQAHAEGLRANAIRDRLAVSLKSVSGFRMKYLIASAIQVMKGGEEWTSEKLFRSSVWVV